MIKNKLAKGILLSLISMAIPTIAFLVTINIHSQNRIRELTKANADLYAQIEDLHMHNLELVEASAEKETIIPDGYLPLPECIPIQDVAGYFYDEYGYLCFELGDYGNQLDCPENWTYENIIMQNGIEKIK